MKPLAFLLYFSIGAFSCTYGRNPNEPGGRPEYDSTTRVTMSALCGRINVEIPKPTTSLVWYGPSSEVGGGTISNEFEFKSSSPYSARLFVNVPITAGKDEKCPEPSLTRTEDFEYMEEIVTKVLHQEGKMKREISLIGKTKVFVVFYETGFYVKGCRYGSYFEIKLTNVPDVKVRESIFKSIKIGE